MHILAFLILVALGLIMFLYLEGYFSCSPLGLVFVPISEEEEQLQKEYPDLKSLHETWMELKADLVHQEWKWDKVSRPTHPIRAFVYRFISPNRLQKKIDLCEEALNEYEMCVKLLRDY